MSGQITQTTPDERHGKAGSSPGTQDKTKRNKGTRTTDVKGQTPRHIAPYDRKTGLNTGGGRKLNARCTRKMLILSERNVVRIGLKVGTHSVDPTRKRAVGVHLPFRRTRPQILLNHDLRPCPALQKMAASLYALRSKTWPVDG